MPRPVGLSVVGERVLALVVGGVLVGVLGMWRPLLTGPHAPAAPSLVVNGMTYTVTHAEQVTGLSDRDLGGLSHGAQGLVPSDKALVVVTLLVTAGSTARTFDAGVLRVVPRGTDTSYEPSGGTLAPGRLEAHGRIEGTLAYVVPRDGAQLELRAPHAPRGLRLLAVDTAGPDSGDHAHVSGGTGAGADDDGPGHGSERGP